MLKIGFVKQNIMSKNLRTASLCYEADNLGFIVTMCYVCQIVITHTINFQVLVYFGLNKHYVAKVSCVVHLL